MRTNRQLGKLYIRCVPYVPIRFQKLEDKDVLRIEYELLSLTCKVLTTTQPLYLHHLISVQPPRSTRSSSLVTLTRPPTPSSLRIGLTDRSFRYASPCLWNQLFSSLRQPHPVPLSLTCLFMLLPHLLTLSTHQFHHP